MTCVARDMISAGISTTHPPTSDVGVSGNKILSEGKVSLHGKDTNSGYPWHDSASCSYHVAFTEA